MSKRCRVFLNLFPATSVNISPNSNVQYVVSATSSECRSPSSFVVAGRCVDVITDVNTYFEARALCRGRGPVADLVQLKTDTDNAQAAAALRTYLNSTELQTPNAFWIGLVRSRWSWEAGGHRGTLSFLPCMIGLYSRIRLQETLDKNGHVRIQLALIIETLGLERTVKWFWPVDSWLIEV